MVTTSRTTTKVVSCLKVPLTSMCVVVRTSFPGSRLRRFFLTSPLPELVFQSIEETLLQPVLKTVITVFIQYNVGLENKLTKTPLLGLAKSIYYQEPTKNMQRNYQGKHCHCWAACNKHHREHQGVLCENKSKGILWQQIPNLIYT